MNWLFLVEPLQLHSIHSTLMDGSNTFHFISLKISFAKRESMHWTAIGRRNSTLHRCQRLWYNLFELIWSSFFNQAQNSTIKLALTKQTRLNVAIDLKIICLQLTSMSDIFVSKTLFFNLQKRQAISVGHTQNAMMLNALSFGVSGIIVAKWKKLILHHVAAKHVSSTDP